MVLSIHQIRLKHKTIDNTVLYTNKLSQLVQGCEGGTKTSDDALGLCSNSNNELATEKSRRSERLRRAAAAASSPSRSDADLNL